MSAPEDADPGHAASLSSEQVAILDLVAEHQLAQHADISGKRLRTKSPGATRQEKDRLLNPLVGLWIRPTYGDERGLWLSPKRIEEICELSGHEPFLTDYLGRQIRAHEEYEAAKRHMDQGFPPFVDVPARSEFGWAGGIEASDDLLAELDAPLFDYDPFFDGQREDDVTMGNSANIHIQNATIGGMAVGPGATASGTANSGTGGPAGQGRKDESAPGSEKRESSTRPSVDRPIDFAILTALEVERRAVCAVFGLSNQHKVRKDGRTYWRGTLDLRNGERCEVVVAQPRDMGQLEAALLAADVIKHWQPRAALLVGIAASTDRNVKLGDVVVGRSVYYYERGKVTPDGMKPQPEMIPADAALLDAAVTLDWEENIPERPDGSEVKAKRHIGVIASGEKVIASAAARDAIAAGHRKIIALEMESYGFSLAMWQSHARVRHLNIRGICDDGSEGKDDRWHGYAATAAAMFAKHFLEDRPHP